jgi:hypothetical protein
MSTETMQLPVKLTPDEIRARGEELAKTLQDINSLEAAKKFSADDFKAQIASKEEHALKLTHAVNSKSEPRQVEIFEEKSYSDSIARIIRRDTGEQVSTRSLTKDEMEEWRQGRLGLDAVTTPAKGTR